MRKSSSTGTLRRLGDAKGDINVANGRQNKMRPSGSMATVAALKPARKASFEQDLHRMGGTHPQGAPLRQQRSLPQSTARGRCVSASALPHFEVSLTPPDLAEDVVLEASFARGLAAAECFELYGPLRSAPALAGGAAEAAGDVHWSGQAATSQQLAACLATPFTGQDQNLGEMVRSKVDQLEADQQLKTQLRYAEELRQRRSEEEEDEEQEALQQQAGRQCRLRIRRRPSEEAAQLADLDLDGGVPFLKPKEAAPLSHSPQTAVALQTLYASLDDDSNRLLLDEEAIMKKTASTDEPADEGCMFPMDGSGEKPGRKRALYNINVHAAPELYGP